MGNEGLDKDFDTERPVNMHNEFVAQVHGYVDRCSLILRTSREPLAPLEVLPVKQRRKDYPKGTCGFDISIERDRSLEDAEKRQ